MKTKIKYIKSKQELQRFGNMFLTEEAIKMMRAL